VLSEIQPLVLKTTCNILGLNDIKPTPAQLGMNSKEERVNSQDVKNISGFWSITME
jgi:hypothetical protein